MNPPADETPRKRRKPESLAKLKRAAHKLFVARGYHATRPQDIAREAGVGHGTFYLHYADKRACFLDFVEMARAELDGYLSMKLEPGRELEETIAAILNAAYDFSEAHPGLLRVAMTDGMVIGGDEQPVPFMVRWGREWAALLRCFAQKGGGVGSFDAEIIGQAIVGAIYQTGTEGRRAGRRRDHLIDNLTRFLVRALQPG